MNDKRIESMFEYHPVTGEKPGIQGAMRFMCLQLARLIMNAIPNCYEREEAIRKLNEVLFWAVAGIDRCTPDGTQSIQETLQDKSVGAAAEKPSSTCHG